MNLVATAALLALAATAAAAAERGAELFEPCRACHSLDPGAEPGAGPSLAGVIGRVVAGDAAFDYSSALREARAAGRVWDRAALEQFLADPEAMFPGLWMSGRGPAEAQDRAALVEWIARNGGAR